MVFLSSRGDIQWNLYSSDIISQMPETVSSCSGEAWKIHACFTALAFCLPVFFSLSFSFSLPLCGMIQSVQWYRSQWCMMPACRLCHEDTLTYLHTCALCVCVWGGGSLVYGYILGTAKGPEKCGHRKKYVHIIVVPRYTVYFHQRRRRQ